MNDWLWFVTITASVLITVLGIVYGCYRDNALVAARHALGSGSIRALDDCLILHYRLLPRRVIRGLETRRDELIIERSEMK